MTHRKRTAPVIWFRKNQYRREAEQLPTRELELRKRSLENDRSQPQMIVDEKYTIIERILRERLYVQEAHPP